MNSIIHNVETVTGYPFKSIRSRLQHEDIVNGRYLLTHEMYAHGATLQEIAVVINRQVNTVYACLSRYKDLQSNKGFREKSDRLKEMRNNVLS